MDLRANPVSSGANPVDLSRDPMDCPTNPLSLSDKPLDLRANPVSLRANPVDLSKNPLDLRDFRVYSINCVTFLCLVHSLFKENHELGEGGSVPVPFGLRRCQN